MLLNFNPSPRKVIIEFENGTVETYEMGEKCGFLREAYTYQTNEANKIVAVLHTYELYWTERKDSLDALHSGNGETSRGVS